MFASLGEDGDEAEAEDEEEGFSCRVFVASRPEVYFVAAIEF